jgi:hypothetical protein
VVSVRRSASSSIQPSISTSPVRSSWTTAAISPSRSRFSAAAISSGRVSVDVDGLDEVVVGVAEVSDTRSIVASIT